MIAAISRGANRQLTATLTAPRSAQPKKNSKYSMPLRSRKATRSPGTTPPEARAAATRQARPWNSPQVTVWSPWVSIGASDRSVAQWRSMAATELV